MSQSKPTCTVQGLLLITSIIQRCIQSHKQSEEPERPRITTTTANGEWTSAYLQQPGQPPGLFILSGTLAFCHHLIRRWRPQASSARPAELRGRGCPQMLLSAGRCSSASGRDGRKIRIPTGSQSQCRSALHDRTPPPPNSSTDSRATPTPMLWPQQWVHGAARFLPETLERSERRRESAGPEPSREPERERRDGAEPQITAVLLSCSVAVSKTTASKRTVDTRTPHRCSSK